MKDKIIGKLIEYVKHKSFCNINTNWGEAIQAMGDTPEQFRDESWQQAYDEMRRKMTICNCGLNNLIDKLAALEAEQPKAEDSQKAELSAEEIQFNYGRCREFVSGWLWDSSKYGDERRSESFDLDQCVDIANMIKSFMKEYASQRNRLPSEEENLG